ncbi:MAG: hypothetical protein ACOCP8_08515, partial [archaeon]
MNKLMDLREDIEYSLADYIPILDIKDNMIFLEDMNVSIILKLSFIYDEILSDKQIISIKSKLMNFLNALEPNIAVRMYFKKDKNIDEIKDKHLNSNKSKKEIVKELFNREIEQVDKDINNNSLFSYNLYIEFRKKFDIDIPNPKKLIYTDKKLSKTQKEQITNIIKEMQELENKYSSYLEKTGHKISKLTEDETINLIASHINFKAIKDIKFTTVNDLIYSDMNIKFDYLRNINKYIGFVTLKQEAEIVYPTIIKYLYRADLNFEYDIILNIQKFNKYDEQQKLKMKKRITRGLKFDWFGDDIDEEKQAQENNISALLEEMVSGKENLFNVELLILIKGSTLEELKNNIDNMSASIKQLEGADG